MATTGYYSPLLTPCTSPSECLSSSSLPRLSNASLLHFQSRKERGVRPPSTHFLASTGKKSSPSRKVSCTIPEHAPGVVTKSSWNEHILKSNVPVLVEFWASWCGPCRMVHPIMDEIAEEYAGKIKCFKLNTDNDPLVADEYGIEKIPTVVLFRDGEKREAVTGTMPKSVYVAAIERSLAS